MRISQIVDVPEIDREHQALLQLCDDLSRANRGHAPLSRVKWIAHEIADRTAAHFAHEEREMRRAPYPHFAWHRRQHHTARTALAALTGRIHQGDRHAARELLSFLPAWLNDHIAIADRMLGAHIRNRRRASVARG
ncbi:MAG TPA: hemerythrin family protein [Bryobacteraceae bacterium]|nr:hemerythrin family protein [Bryobacteraceae bacterium]